ncbi:MAG: ATP-dependent protease ATPase subunit HslU [Christensenellales bacterium]|jgi:ATP-dependent HslUV protease ATP-binding subunit HslU
MNHMTPREIVEQLDRYIVGQKEAKKAVAIALRNRYRRSQLPDAVREEITPKNIIMAGPTGVGKTEIARRLAKLVDAPFVKVEATKFTEVGYVGRDVESMIRDLVEAAIRMVRDASMEKVRVEAARLAENILVDALSDAPRKSTQPANPFAALLPSGYGQPKPPPPDPAETERLKNRRREIRQNLQAGLMEDILVEIEVEEQGPQGDLSGMGVEINIQDMLGSIMPKKTKRRKVTVREARKILEQAEALKLIDMDDVQSKAVEAAENNGIIFIDEIDKVASRGITHGPDVSREGVQRDILPLVEGSTVMTKYGPVKTDYILFIAAGAFHVSKVTDLIPELQGRFPIRVQLDSLTQKDFRDILAQTENAVTKQYAALLGVDKVEVTFTDDALDAMAEYAYKVNEIGENIGARRLHTIMESLLEDISYNAGGDHPEIELLIDAAYVREHLAPLVSGKDLKKYIL